MILAHIIMAIYVFFSAKQEGSVVKAFIHYVPPVNNVSKTFHRAGAWMTFIVAILCSISLGISYHSIPIFLSVLASYWLIFDIVLNTYIGWKWNYIGKTAEIDSLMWKVFGANAEIYTVVLKVLLIVIPVVAYYIW